MLAKKYRLSGEKRFKNIYQRGKFAVGKYVTLRYIYCRVPIANFKIGIVISKKVSPKAVLRNKIKREINEIIHEAINRIPSNIELVFILKKIPESFDNIKSDVLGILEKKVYG